MSNSQGEELKAYIENLAPGSTIEAKVILKDGTQVVAEMVCVHGDKILFVE